MTGRELRFVQPVAEAFRQALPPPNSGRAIILIGQGALAEAWAGGARAAGLHVERRSEVPPPGSVNPGQFLCLAESEGTRLGAMLLACLDMEDVKILAPVTDRHISRNPLYIVSIPKAGTHLVYELARALGYADGIEQPAFPRAQTWYCVEYSNSHTVARDFFVDTVRRAPFGNRHHAFSRTPALFIYRHPLDILVSEAHYYHRDGKTAFSGYFADEDFEQRVDRLANDEWLLGSLRTRLGGFLPWLRFPNVIPVSFEELVGEAGGGQTKAQQRLIWSIQLKLQADGAPEQIAQSIFNRNAATFREGKIGGYRSKLAPDLIEALTEQCRDVLLAYGYSTDTEAMIPAPAADYASRPLHYSTENFDEMPINVEADFMGCNLVRYARHFYAIPLSAGTIALERLSPEIRRRLPFATSLSDLKAILLIGKKNHDRQVAMLTASGLSLQSDRPDQPDAYWQETDAPCIFDTIKGFNLLAWNGRYFALHQSLGPVDLTEDLQTLIQRHGPENLRVANDPDSLRDEVNGRVSESKQEGDVEMRLDVIGHRVRLHLNPGQEQPNSHLDEAKQKNREDLLLALLEEAKLREQALQQRLHRLEANHLVRFGAILGRFFRRQKQ
jgi:hypothetical protein